MRDSTAYFEAIADAFDKATGMLAPGKSVPPEIPVDVEKRDLLWKTFLAGRNSTVKVPYLYDDDAPV